MSSSGRSDNSPQSSKVCSKAVKRAAQLDDKTRLKRNAGEKKRRDKLNTYISELSAMVPSCRMPQSQKKLDKSTILKLTVSYMKLHADLLPDPVDESSISWKPSFMSHEEIGQLMLEALDGFLFVIWSTGRTIYVSEGITPLLGHLQSDLVGKNFLDLIHPEDVSVVRDRMFPHQTENGFIEELGTPSPSSSSINSPGSAASDSPPYLRRNFVTRMRKGGFTPSHEYEMVSCSGHLRKWNEVARNAAVESSEMFPQDGFCLVGVGRLQSTQTIREMTSGAPSLNAWTSHHRMDAKYIFVDQNAPAIVGYTAAELLGSSAYNLYHDEDLNGLARSHVELSKNGTGMTGLYRFLTKGQQWLWIKTHGVLQYREGTTVPQYVICHNVVVSYAEVWQYLQNKARQYGPKEKSPLLPIAAGPPATKTTALPTKSELVTSDGIKAEQFSPKDSSSAGPSTTIIYQNTPGSSTGKVTSSGVGNTFQDLFPGYQQSITTEERHGRYRPLYNGRPLTPPPAPASVPPAVIENGKFYRETPNVTFVAQIEEPVVGRPVESLPEPATFYPTTEAYPYTFYPGEYHPALSQAQPVPSVAPPPAVAPPAAVIATPLPAVYAPTYPPLYKTTYTPSPVVATTAAPAPPAPHPSYTSYPYPDFTRQNRCAQESVPTTRKGTVVYDTSQQVTLKRKREEEQLYRYTALDTGQGGGQT